MMKNINRMAMLMVVAVTSLNVACNKDDKPEGNAPGVNDLLTEEVLQVPGIEKFQQTQIDYSNPDNWMFKQTDSNKAVDVFYIYPSNYNPTEGQPAIGDIDDAGMHAGAQAIYQRQGTAFEPMCNVYAPYYRQVDARYCLTQTTETEWALIRYMASQDLTRALDYYFEHYNQGRPFILAGHSQGSEHALALIQDYFTQDAAHRALLDRMVAAYTLGFSVTDEYLSTSPVPFATGATDTRCIIAWNTEGPGNDGQANAVVKPHSHSINPLNWRLDETPATTAENLGSLTSVEEGVVIPGIADATLNVQRGVVVCTTADPATYAIPGSMAAIFGPESFHGHDYGFYFMNIRQNAQQRINAWINK